MCKTYDAIYKIAQTMESDVLLLWADHKKISGHLHKCDCGCNDNKCFEDVVTLKDATVECCKPDGKCELSQYKWINIPSGAIKAFAFKCCEK